MGISEATIPGKVGGWPCKGAELCWKQAGRVSVLGAEKAQQLGSFKGMGHFLLWFKETACSCYWGYFHEQMVSSEFSVDFWNHWWFHTKWIDYCFRAELNVQKGTLFWKFSRHK